MRELCAAERVRVMVSGGGGGGGRCTEGCVRVRERRVREGLAGHFPHPAEPPSPPKEMDAFTRAELDALEGKRAPPDALFLMGAGEYRATIGGPALKRDAAMRAMAARATGTAAAAAAAAASPGRATRPATGSTPAWQAAGPVHPDALDAAGAAGDLPAALATATQTLAEAEPRHFYDLKATADKKTQELVEREKMVSRPRREG